jgi:Uma2 family endonuclease
MPAGHNGPAAGRPLRNLSTQDYEHMIGAGIVGEDEHVELIGGRIVEMSPEGPGHAGAIDLCAEVLRAAFGAGHRVRVQHPLIVDPLDAPEPDVAVVAGGPRDHLAEHPRTAALVIEVADSSLEYDRGEKAQLYARAGFDDYWIVNLRDRCLEVHRQPSAGGYGSVATVAPDATVTPLALPAARVAVAALLP